MQAMTFGPLVKEMRSALGLTQTELARRVGCAAITIRKIEADDLRPSEQMAELIAVAVNVPEKEQEAFVRLARATRSAPPIPTPTPRASEIGLEDLSGRAVKGFQLGEKIGSGGFGVVYRAVQPLVERDVAVKIILPRYANHPNFIRRFEAEAQIVARLEHPHIVPLYDYWREPDAAYLVMRLLPGGSLEEQLRTGSIPLQLVMKYLQQIGLALDVAHRNGVIHRDIKPANVLLDEEDNAYLADFGIAKSLEEIGSQSLTEDGGLIGSPAYASPEQILSEPVKPQSDIYSLGLLLFEMLTGNKAFSGPTPVAYIRQHLNDSLPSLQDFDPQLPRELDVVIQQATAKKISDRYADVPSMLQAVQLALTIANDSGWTIEDEHYLELTAEEMAELENPYKGLRAFSEADAEHFYGRSTLIQELFARLTEPTELARFLAIVGPSGSGKSSVAKAGLVPALRRGGLPGSENWFVVDLTPGAHPWEEVEIALLRVAVNPPETLLNQLQEGDRGLLRAVGRILPDDDQTELVLIIDQFEEIFTLVEDEAVREQFLSSLVTAVLDERSRLRVIITLRADFYDRPLHYVDFGDLLRQRSVSVLPMTPDELEQAISQPAQDVGVWLEPGLTAVIIRDVGDQPGTLPLLQYSLTELFEQRDKNVLTHAAYEAAGGVTGALARRADEIYKGLDSDARNAARQLFLRLITLGEGVEDTRRRVQLSKTSEVFKTSEVLDEYGRYRLLTFDHDPITRAPTVEVAHEAILREWDRLRQWINDARDDIRQERALARATQEWDTHQRDVSFLMRGKRLVQIEDWQEITSLMLTPLEQEFIDQSLAQRKKERQVELARKEHEARLERRSRNFLRGLVAVFALAALVAAALGLFAFQQRQHALDSAAEAQNVALVAGSQVALADNDTDTALALAWQAVTLKPESALAQAQLSEAAYAPGTVRPLLGFTDYVLAADIDPAGNRIFSGSRDMSVIMWDLATGDILWQVTEHQNAVNDVEFSPDGQIAASISSEAVILWDAATGKPMRKITGQEESFSRMDFSPDGQQLATTDWGDPSYVSIWDVASGEIVQRFPTQSNPDSIVFTPDGSAILFGGYDDGTLTLIDSESGELIQEMNAGLGNSSGALRAVAITPDGGTAVVGFENSQLLLWDLESGELIQSYEVPGGVVTLDLHPEDNTVLIGGTTSVITRLDLESGKILNTFSGHTADVVNIVISSVGQYAVSASLDHSLRLWALDRGHVLRHIAGPSDLTFEADLSPDGRMAIRGSTDGVVTLIDAETGEVMRELVVDQPVMAVTFSPDGKTALIGSGYRFAQKIESGHVILWDVQTGEEIRRFEGQPYVVFDVEFSPDGKMAVSSGNGAIIILWDVATGQEIRRFEDFFEDSEWPGESYWDVEFSPDGRSILASYAKGPLIQWDIASGEQIRQMVGHDTGSPGVAFDMDGQRAVSGGFDAQAILWDMTTGDIIRRFANHAGSLGQVSFSPDGQLLLGSSSDGTSSLWDIASGEVLRRYGNGWVMKFIFTEDGRQALAGYRTGALEFWRIDSTLEDLLSWTEANRYIPEITCEQRALYGVEPLCEAEE